MRKPMPIRRRTLLGAALALSLGPGLALPGRAEAAGTTGALIGVAASFAAPARAIAKAYAAASGNTIRLAVAPTVTLQSRIIKGAPYDAMLSDDALTPEELATVGYVVRDSRFTYAVGKLALWYPRGTKITDPAALMMDPKIAHVAMADPDLTPYGAAAREAIDALGLERKLDAKLLKAPDVGGALAMVRTGKASLGFVAYSALTGPQAPRGGAVWVVPTSDYAPIHQDAALLKHGRNNAAARGFLDFLKGPQARKVMAAYGYGAI
ncbi:molybdate ABC transporter substrate-binding protein [Acidimangrovimonas sediminis]|uniref:molybdate ABC transporter substrate-binding protein n=1 Tax=Acidimangrovimonas sediminis TaxID=2056283 RepID=UPI001304CDCE|nr:molybdate ABC transporter substrate-binding protein [Acidimangrovimonas sediminis]